MDESWMRIMRPSRSTSDTNSREKWGCRWCLLKAVSNVENRSQNSHKMADLHFSGHRCISRTKFALQISWDTDVFSSKWLHYMVMTHSMHTEWTVTKFKHNDWFAFCICVNNYMDSISIYCKRKHSGYSRNIFMF